MEKTFIVTLLLLLLLLTIIYRIRKIIKKIFPKKRIFNIAVPVMPKIGIVDPFLNNEIRCRNANRFTKSGACPTSNADAETGKEFYTSHECDKYFISRGKGNKNEIDFININRVLFLF